MSSARTAVPWPTNLGAYTRTAVTAPSVVTLGALTTTSASPEAVASFVLALAAALAGLFTSERWRAACSWAGTAAAVVPLALARYEGEQAISVGTLLQLDARDLLTIVVMVGTSLLVQFVPNATARYAPEHYEDPSLVGDVVPAPVLATDDGELGTEGVTSVLAALSEQEVAADAEAKALVPAQGPAPEAERAGLLAGLLGRRDGRHEL